MPVNKNGFAQICIVVKDVRAAAKMWSLVLGIDEPEIEERHLETSDEFPYTYRGEFEPCDLLVADIHITDGLVIELHQPAGGESSFEEFIRKHGNGVHHLGFEVGDARDSVIEELKSLGFDTNRTFGAYEGSSWTIVDSEDTLGVNLNIKPVR